MSGIVAAHAQKFALIDMEFILKQIPSYEQANKQMENLSKQWQAEVEAKSKEAKALYEAYQKSASGLSTEQRTAKEEEIIAKSAIEYWYYSNIDGGEIVARILNLLECEEITIEDLETMEFDDLKELISEDKADFEENTCKDVILSNFIYKDYNCVFFKDKERLILTFEKNNDVDVCIFNSLEEMLAYIVNSRLKVKEAIIE